MEKTPEEYVAKMVEVFREVRRVLKKEGTLWLNLGDSYGGSGKGPDGKRSDIVNNAAGVAEAFTSDIIKPKDLCGIPWRVAFALQADGWWLRQDIIWAKPNPMPESVTDRCTKAHEYVFLMTKNQHYYFDVEAIKEKANTKPHCMGGKQTSSDRNDGDRQDIVIGGDGCRNRRSVFSVPAQYAKMRDDLSDEQKKILVAELLKRGII